MARPIRIRRRLTIAILVTALIPVLVAMWLAANTVRDTSAKFFVPEVGARLDRSLGLYQELARTVKASMRHEATAIAADEALRQALRSGDRARLEDELRRLFREHPGLLSLSVRRADRTLASIERQHPFDKARENSLEIARPLGPSRELRDGGAGEAPPEPGDDELDPETPELVAVFVAGKAQFDELAEASQFVESYHRIEERRAADERGYVSMFAVLLGITILAAVGVGSLLARTVSRRVVGLERATQRVALGDLSVRVPEAGHDEISALARAFNRMLAEVESSRGRIEYLQRISAWQEMARRLAHEIKNPLTPIQLAVQDIHRRYDGKNGEYQKLLDTTLEVVEDEVGTLRRLVSEFSDFARLPRAELERADLAAFLRELSDRPLLGEDERRSEPDGVGDGVTIDFELPEGPAWVEVDRQMLRRVLINLVRNAAQAIGRGRGSGRVLVRLEKAGSDWLLEVEDDGPGIPDELREAIFDPYVTTRTDGTGLGLAIVKKIVVEHRGAISASKSPPGGAKITIRLPAVA